MATSNSAPLPGIPGIDVSHYQAQIDWPAVAKAGIRYAVIKATEGNSIVDAYYQRNWTASRNAGIVRGAYHFFRPKVPVLPQADLFVHTVQRLEPGDLPPTLDLEAPTDWTGVETKQRVALAIEWLDSVEKRLGATPFVYLSPSFVDEVLVDASALARFPLWIAQYAPAPRVPKPWKHWTIWQHTPAGNIAGITGTLDLDWFQGREIKTVDAPEVSPTAGATARESPSKPHSTTGT